MGFRSLNYLQADPAVNIFLSPIKHSHREIDRIPWTSGRNGLIYGHILSAQPQIKLAVQRSQILSMSPIPDFTASEIWSTKTTLKERYGQDIAIELADSELKLDPASLQLTSCPTIFWQQRKVNFVIFKFGDHQY